MSQDIVITGEGIISAIGNNKDEVLQSLREKKSGIAEMQYLQSSHHELPVGEVKLSNDEMKTLLGIEQSEEISRNTLLGIIAVKEALKESNLSSTDNKHIVLISGTTVGGMDITEQHFEGFTQTDERPDCLLKHDCGSSTEDIAGYFGLFEEKTTISTACSSAANALILGARLLEAGEADIVVAGGTEALTRFHLNGFNSLMILDREQCRPFDEDRAGLNLGEGAAYVVMEKESSARARHAVIHGWLRGYGNACDAFHQTATSAEGEGAYLAMREALEMADIDSSAIDYVNAHGTGTRNNDETEVRALRRVFGEHLPLISSTKGFTGHTTSASGSIEAVICLLAMRYGFVPANIGWKRGMKEGDMRPSIGEEGCCLRYVMSNSFGFGGNDSVLILSSEGGRAATGSQHRVTKQEEIGVAATIEITDERELAELKRYMGVMDVRRMGKLMKGALLASLKALEQAGLECPDAIITATRLGQLEQTERLLLELRDNGEVTPRPTHFMQSTHNTLGSGVAIQTKCHGYNMTYADGGESMEWALRDAELLIRSGRAKTVLVGEYEETTELWRRQMAKLEALDVVDATGSQHGERGEIPSGRTARHCEDIYCKVMILRCGR
ncbi:MAG: beta-ketoacyl-[Prevotella sp.]|nr:beta-ketoacyl-[acyl-carrier-protein] synthase family protein [Prevotella sp.]